MTLSESVELFESIKDLLLKGVPDKYHHSMATTFIRGYLGTYDLLSLEEYKKRLIPLLENASVKERIRNYYQDPYANVISDLSEPCNHKRIPYRDAKKNWDTLMLLYKKVNYYLEMDALHDILNYLYVLEQLSPLFALTKIHTRNKMIKILKENGYNTRKVKLNI